MFELAFSRRICCSRVCRAMRRATLPRASFDTPMIRPGIARLYSSRLAKKRRVRAAVAHGHAESLGRTEHHVGTQRPPAGSATAGLADRSPHRPRLAGHADDRSMDADRALRHGCRDIAAARRTPGAVSSYPQRRRSARNRTLRPGSAPRKWSASGNSHRRKKTGYFWIWPHVWPEPWPRLPPWLHPAVRRWPVPGRSGRWSAAGNSATLRAGLGRSLVDRAYRQCTNRDFSSTLRRMTAGVRVPWYPMPIRLVQTWFCSA